MKSFPIDVVTGRSKRNPPGVGRQPLAHLAFGQVALEQPPPEGAVGTRAHGYQVPSGPVVVGLELFGFFGPDFHATN